MKSKERHHLKQNEFAETAGRFADVFAEHRNSIIAVVGGLLAVVLIVGGFFTWRKMQTDRAGALLGAALEIPSAQIAPPSTLPGAVQAPGTYPSAQARGEDALKAFQAVVAAYPGSQAAITANYNAATELLELGRFADAEQAFKKVIDANSPVYTPVARLGMAEALLGAGKTDDAIKMFTDIAGDRDGALPVDGVLMQLARACTQAGKVQDARAAYKRVTDEFPESKYSDEAKQQLAAVN